jgi:hypothetical protein
MSRPGLRFTGLCKAVSRVRNGQATAAAPSATSGDADTDALLKSLGV